jgi:hypothetical protein
MPACAAQGGAVVRSLRDFFLGVGVFLACLFFLLPCAVAGEVTLAWDSNPETDIAGYRIYIGAESRHYDDVIDVGKNTSCVVSGLEEGRTYYFAATAYNTVNLESGFSNEAVTTLSAVSEAYVDPDRQESESPVVNVDGSDIGVDLAGEWLSIRRSFIRWTSYVNGSLRVVNLGDQPAASSVVYIYESTDSVWDNRDRYLGKVSIPMLEAGQTFDISFRFKSYFSWGRFFIAVLDSEYALDDVDEENNIVISWPVR